MNSGTEVAARPLLLLLASGARPHREHPLRSIATEFRVHRLHTVEPARRHRVPSGWTVAPDTHGGPATATAAGRPRPAAVPVGAGAGVPAAAVPVVEPA